MLDAIAYDVDRMGSVVRDLVDASRLAAGRLELSAEPVELGGLVGGVAAGAARNPDHPEVLWEGEDLRLTADPARLGGAIGAMVQAAAWWGQEGPVRVRAARAGGAVEIVVSARGDRADARRRRGAVRRAPARRRRGSRARRCTWPGGWHEARGGSLTADVSDGFALRLVLPTRN